MLASCERAGAPPPQPVPLVTMKNGEQTSLAQVGRTGAKVIPGFGDLGHFVVPAIGRTGEAGILFNRSLSSQQARRWRLRDGRLEIEQLPPKLENAPFAVTPDGETFVVQDPEKRGFGLAVVDRSGRRTPIDLVALGRMAYGVAISDDGQRVAFSAQRADCVDSPASHTCPVKLYGFDVTSGTTTAIAADDSEVAYGPQFLDPEGAQLVFMTSKGDNSAECRAKFAVDCSFRIMRVPFEGGRAELVVDDGILPSPARDAIVFMRLSRTGSKRNWASPPTVMVHDANGDRVLGETGPVRNDILRVSPDGTRVAFVSTDGSSLVVAPIDGSPPTTTPIAHLERVLGWAAASLEVKP